MSIAKKLPKAFRLLSNAHFARVLARHHVAAATEHLEVIRFCAPNTLLDVGANKGQFSTAVRGLLPSTEIHAFEPLPEAAERFSAVFQGDAATHLYRVALGPENGAHTFHVTDRDDSSSLLEPSDKQMAAYGVVTSKLIVVEVKTLGSILDIEVLTRPVLLKIDVQGSELGVLKGISNLEGIDYIYIELSFVELYKDQSLFEDVRENLAARGFALRGVVNPSITQAYGPTQADCLFVRSNPRPYALPEF